MIWPLGDPDHRVKLWKDGVGCTVLEPGECCVVQQARHHALMVVLNQGPSYYRTLAHKLHWASSLAASQPSPN